MNQPAATTDNGQTSADQDHAFDEDTISLSELLAGLMAEWKRIIAISFTAGLTGLGIAFLISPTYTARAVILPPQQQQGGISAALSSLGSLAGLAGASIKTPADQYVSFLMSDTIGNRIIDQYKLMEIYDREFRVDALKDLSKNVHVQVGKKDGLITIEVDDENPVRSANMANSFVDGLRVLTNTLAVSEAQQRRLFFEQQLQAAKAKLTQAQVALQDSGFNSGALKAEPRAAAEGYAKLKAEVTSVEVRLQAMHGMLTDNAPEVVQQQAILSALRSQLINLEVSGAARNDADYIGRYREFKYQETLFDLFAKQYELAKIDEAREGALVQVVDVASVPEKKSRPKRALIALGCALGSGLLAALVVLMRHARRLRRVATAT